MANPKLSFVYKAGNIQVDITHTFTFSPEEVALLSKALEKGYLEFRAMSEKSNFETEAISKFESAGFIEADTYRITALGKQFLES
jgi:hypothetical protein